MVEAYKVALSNEYEFANDPQDVSHPFNGNWSLPREYFIPGKTSYRLSPLKQLYLLTLGTASQLRLDSFVGNFATGKEADFVALDLASSPILRRRLDVLRRREPHAAEDIAYIANALFGAMTVANDRTVRQTYVAGELAYDREENYFSNLDDDYQAGFRPAVHVAVR